MAQPETAIRADRGAPIKNIDNVQRPGPDESPALIATARLPDLTSEPRSQDSVLQNDLTARNSMLNLRFF
jgi:hypothetical protein